MSRYIDAIELADKLHDMLGVGYSEMVDVLATVSTADVKPVVEFEKLQAEIEQLKARLEKSVELPCEVGEIVYTIRRIYKCNNCEHNRIEIKRPKNIDHCDIYCKSIGKPHGLCDKQDKVIIYPEEFTINHFSIYNKKLKSNVFLTREEAEKALKESDNNAIL